MNELGERVDLEPLDPGEGDPGYWFRFHGRVMDQVRGELALRRMAGEWSIAETVFQWRKTLVPLTLLAAALAGVLVLGHEEPGSPFSPLALEDALIEGLSGDPIPMVLERTVEFDEVAFLSPAGGFRP